MSLPNYIQKTLVMKPEVSKIYDDLEDWLDYCRWSMIKFDPADLYKSKEYKAFVKEKNKKEKPVSKNKKIQTNNKE